MFKNQLNKIDTYKEGIAVKEKDIKKLAEGLVVFIKSLKKVGINYKIITPNYIKIKIKQLINELLNGTTAFLACLEALKGLIPK